MRFVAMYLCGKSSRAQTSLLLHALTLKAMQGHGVTDTSRKIEVCLSRFRHNGTSRAVLTPHVLEPTQRYPIPVTPGSDWLHP